MDNRHFVMNPMHECRGLLLASTATQKGDLPALASTTATSESFDSGTHDNRPVLTQNVPSEQRFLYVRCFTPAVGAFLLRFSGTQLAAWAGHPRTVSPCGQMPVRRQWSVRQQGALAHVYCCTNVLESQGVPEAPGDNSSPWLETRGLLATKVEASLVTLSMIGRRI